MKTMKSTGSINFEIAAGEHILHFYNSESQRLSVLKEFIKDGFRKHNKSIGVINKDDLYKVEDMLIKDDIDAGYYLIEGQLVFMAHEDYFATGGSFDEKRFSDVITGAINAAIRQGWDGANIANDLTWAATGSNVDAWLRFEANANNYIRTLPATCLCQYDERIIPSAVLTNLIKTHPFVILGDSIRQNPFFISQKKYQKHYSLN
ncbi:MAG: MEDS domain-containing protein [Candidatus Aquicultor sp.]